MKKRTILKMTLSVLLVALACIAALTRRTPYALLALPGMLLGFHGDMCLAKAGPVSKLYKEPFLVGACSFLIGHIFYIFALVSSGPLATGAFWGALLLYALVTLIAWVASMRKSKERRAFRIALLCYALMIGVMASFGFSAAIARGGVFWLAALGGLLFVLSDGVIALNDFVGIKIPHHEEIIWGTYVPAQLCLVLIGFFA